MSKALGAAFLHHQVEQLEKSVSNTDANRRTKDNRKPSSYYSIDSPRNYTQGSKARLSPTRPPKISSDGTIKSEQPPKKDYSKFSKDADIVIVDASVLIHGIGHLKKWCRDGRDEIVIIPLEGMHPLT